MCRPALANVGVRFLRLFKTKIWKNLKIQVFLQFTIFSQKTKCKLFSKLV